MNFKNILTSVVAGASLLTMVGTASADMAANINGYGASAQYIVWSTNAADYMTKQGCTVVGTAYLGSGTPWKADGKNSITKATCPSGTRYFRYSAKASYDGPLAMQGNTTNPFRTNNCPNATDRQFVDDVINSCNFTTGQCTGSLTAANCMPVTMGASDVPVECFVQESHGLLLGPLGGAQTDRNFQVAANKIKWTGAAPCKPMVVPFAYYVNNSVTKNHTTISNINRDNAELIFSGAANYWSDMVDTDGVAFDSIPIQVCMRHAGSGTHASLDAYITSPLIAAASVANPMGSDYEAFFNDGSSDLMKCVNGSGTWVGTGAIGYADADQVLGTTYPTTTRINLNGVTPSATAIAGGSYNFYGLQQMYGVSATDPLCTYAKNPANIANPIWVAECNMTYTRSNGCESFPLTYRGANCP